MVDLVKLMEDVKEVAVDDKDVDPFEERVDFSSRETVYFYVVYDPERWGSHGWRNYSVDTIYIDGKDGIMGAASYEDAYSGFLDYVIEGMCDEITTEGWYVLENFHGVYTRGDGYSTDDDMDFYSDDPRPATSEEISKHCLDEILTGT